MNRNHPWFKRGVEALGLVFPGIPKGYLCPLCLTTQGQSRLFSYEALTGEDVPPKCYGGKKTVLTCADCNHPAGAGVDAELSKFLRVRDFYQRKEGSLRMGRVSIGDVSANTLLGWEDGGLKIVDFESHNSPETTRSLISELNRRADHQGTEWSFGLTLNDAYRRQGPEISLLRAAYLIAFAALGYRYICQDVLEPIRRQIKNPYERILGEFFYVVKASEDFTIRKLAIVREPVSCQSVLVQIGPYRIFLPLCRETPNIYKSLPLEIKRQKRGPVLSVLEITWPEEPVFAFDFCPGLVGEVLRNLARARSNG